MELVSRDISGDFPLSKAKSPIFEFFDPIGGISPSIKAFFYNNYELSGISPSIYSAQVLDLI
jgi:hypothetical protein